MNRRAAFALVGIALLVCAAAAQHASISAIGREIAIPQHLRDGDEFKRSLSELVDYGNKLFVANWTDADGAGRPLTKGTGRPIAHSIESPRPTRTPAPAVTTRHTASQAAVEISSRVSSFSRSASTR
jgi:hypothetical protein